MKAIRINKNGGPEVLTTVEVEQPAPGPGQAVVEQMAIGVNFIDIYHRTGLYPVSLPFTPGLEGAGKVQAVGEGVTEVSVGDRVAYTGVSGAYAELAVVPAERLVKVPDGIDYQHAAAAMLQGMTAHYLATTTYPIQNGDTVLIHAAAGGVGLLLVQIAKMRGATVIGTVSTEEKAALVTKHGADKVILYTQADFEKEVSTFTNGNGVQAVYDSVGQTTFMKSLNCIARLGYMVSFGQSSGPVSPFEPAILGQKGSLFLTRPSLFHYIADRQSLVARSQEVFSWISTGKLHMRLGQIMKLSDVAEAHRALEGRKTTGKVLLIP